MYKVSVIIPTYKDNERLEICLNALNIQTYPHDLFEVLVINNDPDENLNIKKSYSFNLVVLNEKSPGSYAARNLGIKHCNGEICAFTDSDCVPATDWIEQGVGAITSFNSYYIILAGKINLFFKNSNNLSYAECYEKVFAFPHQRGNNVTLEGMVTANVFIFSETFREVGVFNKKLMSGGDSEFSNRVKVNNYTIYYCPKCIINHPARYSLKNLIEKRRRIFNGKVFREIQVNKNKKIASLFKVLKKQTGRYLKEIFYAFKTPLVDSLNCRFKLIMTILSILFSVFIESIYIIFTNRVLR